MARGAADVAAAEGYTWSNWDNVDVAVDDGDDVGGELLLQWQDVVCQSELLTATLTASPDGGIEETRYCSIHNHTRPHFNRRLKWLIRPRTVSHSPMLF